MVHGPAVVPARAMNHRLKCFLADLEKGNFSESLPFYATEDVKSFMIVQDADHISNIRKDICNI